MTFAHQPTYPPSKVFWRALDGKPSGHKCLCSGCSKGATNEGLHKGLPLVSTLHKLSYYSSEQRIKCVFPRQPSVVRKQYRELICLHSFSSYFPETQTHIASKPVSLHQIAISCWLYGNCQRLNKLLGFSWWFFFNRKLHLIKSQPLWGRMQWKPYSCLFGLLAVNFHVYIYWFFFCMGERWACAAQHTCGGQRISFLVLFL